MSTREDAEFRSNAVKTIFLLTFTGLLWLAHERGPVRAKPDAAAIQAKRIEACNVAKKAKEELVAKNLNRQVEQLNVEAVCEPEKGRQRVGVVIIAALAGLAFLALTLIARVPLSLG